MQISKKCIVLLFICWALTTTAQQKQAWVYFTDKPNKESFLASPTLMLSVKAIERRLKQNILIDEKDVPIETVYLEEIANIEGVSILAKSKWLNAIHIEADFQLIESLNEMSFVNSIEYLDKSISTKGKHSNYTTKSKFSNIKIDSIQYGTSFNQIEMVNGEVLHDNNLKGKDVTIAILDAGFPNVNTLAPFNHLLERNQILGGYNFVERNENFYSRHYHGTLVLSTIAAYIENEFIGTAPDANFYLFITEDSSKETPLEESLWVEAAEKADSLGVDIINTSLGYSTFDNSAHNYTYNHMDGTSTFISRGAEIAFSRGIFLINSAGNEGASSWKYITAPADAPSVLSVGAVDDIQQVASFSSFGPSFDGRIKPEIAAQGANVKVITTAGSVATSNGTSFSSPIIAGLVACLKQAYPNEKNELLLELIKNSASLFPSYTDQIGYGVPNFEWVYEELKAANNVNQEIVVYPNPSSNKITIHFTEEMGSQIYLTIYSMTGKLVLDKLIYNYDPSVDISNFVSGTYLVKLENGAFNLSSKIIKE